MPRLIDRPTDPRPMGLGELAAALDDDPIDFRDEDGIAARAPLLAALAADRDLVGRAAMDQLRDRCIGRGTINRYGPPVMMLATGRTGWFLRANIWPAARDPAMRASGPAPFFYGVPHDHDFSFLTVGYFGPGYESDYWEYDYAGVAGAPGEAVALRPRGRHRLEPGRIMLYRAHRDVHSQHPPASLSVTLNIMESSPRQPWLDQYRFDPAEGRVAGFLNPLSATALMPLVAWAGGEEGLALLAETARRHPSERLAFAALSAAAGAAPDLAGRLAVLADGERSARGQVAAMAAAAAVELEAHREWIETAG